MGSDFEQECTSLASRVLDVCRSFPVPYVALSIALAMDQPITARTISEGMRVPEPFVRKVIGALRLAATIECELPRGGRNAEKQVKYRLPTQIQYDKYWESMLGSSTLISASLSTEHTAALINELQDIMSFKYVKHVTGYTGAQRMAAYASFEADCERLEIDTRKALAQQLGIDPVWQGLPSLAPKAKPTTNPDAFYLLKDPLTASFETGEAAVAAQFDHTDGYGTTLVNFLGGHEHANLAPTPHLTLSFDETHYALKLRNQRFLAAQGLIFQPLPFTYQQALAAEQDALVELIARTLQPLGVEPIIAPKPLVETAQAISS